MHFTAALLLVISTLPALGNANDRILFSSGRNGNSDIFIMDGNGENIIQLTSTPDEEWAPCWVGQNEITFLRESNSVITRHKMDIRTLEEVRLDHPPNCTLDDKNILYRPGNPAGLFQCGYDIFLWPAEDAKPVNLTEEIRGRANYHAWSADDDQILFTSDHEGNNDVYQMNLVTAELVNLTNSPANDERGDLSPDGKLLAFSSNRFDRSNQEIIILDLVTREVTNISNSDGMELIARWSTDGRTIYYGSNKDGNWEIYSYSLETEKTRRLTDDDGFDGDPRVR